MPAFQTPVDIANKALSLLRQPAIFSFQDNTVQSIEAARVYDQLRLSELRRAVWRFSTRRVILRAINYTTMQFVAPPWDGALDYVPGDVVSYQGQLWAATVASSGDVPGVVPQYGTLIWDSYFGPNVADVWRAPVSPAGRSSGSGDLSPTSYFTDELVFKTPGDATYIVYRSLINGNTDDPEGVDEWVDDQVYKEDQVISFAGTNYQSQIDLNFNNQPDTSTSQWSTTITSPLVSNNWRIVGDEGDHLLLPLAIIYPLGAGPASDTRTRNCFRLPNGFLRQAPTDPKADINPYLGAPTGSIMTDWIFESNYIVSRMGDGIMLRFVADVQSVPEFDPLFAEGLATRLAIELAPRLADADHFATIIADTREEYSRSISEARAVNGIETGPISPVEDDFITCRL